MLKDQDKIVLSYHDSLLYESDVCLLDDKQWLNDRLIGFAYEHMEREVFTDSPPSLFLFMTPSTVQCLKFCQSIQEADMCFLEPLDARNKRFIFMPINNNADAERVGGSHWSLLVYDKDRSLFVHYDSIGSNENVAKSFVKKYSSYFGASGECYRKAAKFAKQVNSYDCGMYMLAATELIADQVRVNTVKGGKYDVLDADLSRLDSPLYIKESRKRYQQNIRSLAQQQQK